MRRHMMIVAAGLLALAATLYSGLWFLAAENLRTGIERWAVDRRAAGWTVAWESLSVGGFPFALRARVAAPRIANPKSVPRWDWRGPELVATARPWSLDRPAVAFPGGHRISIASDGISREITLTAAEAVGAIRIRGGAPGEVTAKLAEFEIRQAGGAQLSADALSFRLVFPPPAGGAAPSAPTEPTAPTAPVAPAAPAVPGGTRVSVALAGVRLPAGPQAVLGREMRALEAEVKLPGISGFRPPLRGGLRAALAAWRDGGGTVEIKRLFLDWGGMRFDGDGTAALDVDMQPVGAMRARIQGYRALVDGLVRAGLVPARNAGTAKFVLNIVAQTTPGGGNTITVPVTVQDRRLSVGPAKLMKLPRVEWRE